MFFKWPLNKLADYVKVIRNDYYVKKQRSRNNMLLRSCFQSVVSTPPLQCNPSSDVELHATTSHFHLPMYITAIKSLLRYYNDITVIVHDDGSFTEEDRHLVQEHIRGITVIEKTRADAVLKEKMTSFPLCRKFRKNVINAMELFDNILLAGKEKIVSMNSDVLFLKKPLDVINWIKSESHSIMSVYEEQPAHQKDFLQKWNCRIPPHITLCLVAFYKKFFDMAFVEDVLSHTGFDWYTAQNVYPLLFSRAEDKQPVVFLNTDQYQSSGVFPDNAVFRQYWTSTGFFNEIQFRDADSVISELSTKEVEKYSSGR
ncbi:MAG TPA: hypothetical protein VKY57_11200 [Chitinispirillaceae bacterium]|nr:hypothetical protein [Chitinispirillaceae bacterium]